MLPTPCNMCFCAREFRVYKGKWITKYKCTLCGATIEPGSIYPVDGCSEFVDTRDITNGTPRDVGGEGEK